MRDDKRMEGIAELGEYVRELELACLGLTGIVECGLASENSEGRAREAAAQLRQMIQSRMPLPLGAYPEGK